MRTYSGWDCIHILRRLLTLVFDHLKPEKLQIVIFENKAVVDVHGVFIRPHVLFGTCVVMYIHDVGFCIAYSVTWFSQDLNSGQAIKGIRVFFLF